MFRDILKIWPTFPLAELLHNLVWEFPNAQLLNKNCAGFFPISSQNPFTHSMITSIITGCCEKCVCMCVEAQIKHSINPSISN